MKIAGISAAVPKKIVEPSFAYEKFGELAVDRIVGNTGVLQKREAEPGTTAAGSIAAGATIRLVVAALVDRTPTEVAIGDDLFVELHA